MRKPHRNERSKETPIPLSFKKNLLAEVEQAADKVLGDPVSVDAIEVDGTLEDYSVRICTSKHISTPLHPDEEGEGIEGGDYKSYEEWLQEVEALGEEYKHYAKELERELPGFSVTFSCAFVGPQAPGHPVGWHNQYFVEVPEDFVCAPIKSVS